MGATRDKPRINRSLISLKVVVFFVITGITALHVLHATKPLLLGFKFDDYRTITIIAPFVSILGPLIVGPLADRLAAKNSTNFGRVLRFLTAFCLFIAAIVYACLFAVTEVVKEPAQRPLVSFGCNNDGAVIFQERCHELGICNKLRKGIVDLTNCTYTCQDPNHYENMYKPWLENLTTPPPSTEHSSEFDYEDESTAVTESLRTKRAAAAAAAAANAPKLRSVELTASVESPNGGELISAEVQHGGRAVRAAPSKVYVEPPHLCLTEKNGDGATVVKKCHVYTDDTASIQADTVMHPALSTMHGKDTNSSEWCIFPLDGFQCHIPEKQVDYMVKLKNGTECKPLVECQLIEPYDNKESVLNDSQCVDFAGYTVIRLLGDIFAMAALTLLNTAIVIAVRETSEGRGEVCRQYVWGAIGYVLLFSPLELFFFAKETRHDAALVALILVLVCFIIAALVLLFASHMPLSPAEWWWHTKTGMLVYPMSAIRRYSPEIFVLTLVAILFGTFWSSIHSFLPWTFTDPNAISFAGLLLIFVLFFNIDKFIEYCGHSNIFIAGFALFIIRFTALTDSDTAWLTIVMEAIEPVVIGIIWITIILYMRHAMPRKLTATGQAIGVLAFFGLGKGFGALIGLARGDYSPNVNAAEIHQWLAVAACIIALVYFVMYNLILAPRCTAKPQHMDDLLSGSASQNFAGPAGNGANGANAGNGSGLGSSGNGNTGAALNANGSYSPLRVYHNERGKKGQFRF